MSNGLPPALSSLENPLSDEQIAELEDSLVTIGVTRNALEKARQAGIDLSDQIRKLDETEKQARALLQVYGKG